MDQSKQLEELLSEVKELREQVKKLESDIEDIKYFTPQHKPVFDKEMVSTIGGFLIGALVIIGIFF